MSNYRPIKEIFDFEKGSLQSSKAIDGEYNFITASSEWKKHNSYENDKEALIIAVAASGSLGRVHYVNGKFISSDLCFILTPKDQKKSPVDLQFYQHIFQSIRQDLVQATATGTSKLAINQSNFGNYKIPYFDIEHQIKYKEKFVKLEEQQFQFKSQIDRQKTNLKNLRQQILQDAIEGKLTKEWREQNPDVEPASELLKRIKEEKEKLIAEKKIKKEKPLPAINESEIPFELPENWVWTRLGEVCCRIHYGFNASAKKEKDGVRLLRITDIQDNKVFWDSVPGCDHSQKDIETYGLNENDIVIARTGGTIGKSFLVKNKTVESLFASYLIRLIPSKILSPEYIKLFLETPIYWKQLLNASWGAGQPNVNGSSLQKLSLPLPPLLEQQAIVSKLQTLMQKLDEAEKQIENSLETSKLLTKAILAEAFKVHE